MQLKALSVHPWNSRIQRVISDLEQGLYAVQETQPERLKALTSRKRQSINLSPTWWQMEKEIQYTRSNLSINYGPICGCQGLLKCWSKKKKILQGPNSVPLSETVVVRQWWKICVTEEPWVSLSLSRTQSRSLRAAGWRSLRSRGIFNRRSLVQVCRVQEQVAEPLRALCFQHCAVTPPPPQREESHPNTGSITCYIINMLCPHCIWLSSHFGSTFVPSSRTDLAYAHTCFCTTASHS